MDEIKNEQKTENSAVVKTTSSSPKGPTSEGSKKRRNIIIGVIILAVAGIWLYQNQSTKAPAESPSETPEVESEAFLNREGMKKVQLISNFENSVVKNTPTAMFDKRLVVKGKLSKGYLYMKTTIDGKPIVAPDDMYLNLTAANVSGIYEAFGGHLKYDNNLAASSTTETEVFQDLKTIPYKERYYEDESMKKTADWLTVLNEHTDPRLVAFVSTLGQGKIEELSLYYDCETASDCEITIRESEGK